MIADVLGALQRMGSNPPPAILVKPGDMSEAVRAATVMGSLIPELKIGDRGSAPQPRRPNRKTRESIARERDELTEKSKALAADKMRLAALIDARQQSLVSAQDALGSQQQRATELAKKATSLKDLLTRLDSENAARRAAAAAAHATEVAAATEIEARAQAARGADPARLKPEIAFANAKGTGAATRRGRNSEDLRLAGRPRRCRTWRLTGDARWSDRLRAGGRRRGVRRRYRTYGQLLIIDAGGGYYVSARRHGSNQRPVGRVRAGGRTVGIMGTDPSAWRRRPQLARRGRFSI